MCNSFAYDYHLIKNNFNKIATTVVVMILNCFNKPPMVVTVFTVFKGSDADGVAVLSLDRSMKRLDPDLVPRVLSQMVEHVARGRRRLDRLDAEVRVVDGLTGLFLLLQEHAVLDVETLDVLLVASHLPGDADGG